MKARTPNQRNNNKNDKESRDSKAVTKSGYLDPNRSLSIIKEDIKAVYNDLIEKLTPADLGIDESSIDGVDEFSLKSTKILNLIYIIYENIDRFQISNLLKKPARKYVLELLEQELNQLLEKQYSSPENEIYPSKLDMLLDIMGNTYRNSIKNSNLPDEIKTTVLDTHEKFTHKKLQELNISLEEFDKMINPELYDKPEKTQKPEAVQEESVEIEKQVETHKKTKVTAQEKTETSIETPEPNANTSESNNSFYNQVKAYTNNFQFLFVSEYMRAEKHKYGKFENYENYLKYDTFQKKLKDYKNKRHITELAAIQRILQSKKDSIRQELLRIDPVFISILESREKAILERINEEK